MDVRERYELGEEPFRYVLEYVMRHVWTNHVGLITDNSDGYTVKVQPAIKYKQTMPDETVKDLDMPVLEDIPICHIGGGGVVLTIPIAKGDEVLLNHAARPIDTWWNSGGSQPQIDSRMHSISDAIAIPGLWSNPRKIQNVSTSTVQLRTTGGTTTRGADGKATLKPHAFIEMLPTGEINVHSEKTWTTDVPQHNYTGDVTITGTLRATEVISTKTGDVHLSSHIHNEVVKGGDTTSAPIPGSMLWKWGLAPVQTNIIAALLALDILLRLLHAIS
jgi:hypothetical protein